MPTKFYTSREAARILDVCPNSLRKWADNGEINCIRTKSGQRRYDVDSYIGKSTDSTTICYSISTDTLRLICKSDGVFKHSVLSFLLFPKQYDTLLLESKHLMRWHHQPPEK